MCLWDEMSTVYLVCHLDWKSGTFISLMPFDNVCLLPNLPSQGSLTSVLSTSPHWSSWALTPYSSSPLGWVATAGEFSPVWGWLEGGGTALGKFLLPSPLYSNSYIFLLWGVLESPLGKSGFLHIVSHPCVSAQVSTLQVFSRLQQECLEWFYWLCTLYQGLPLLGVQVGETPPRPYSYNSHERQYFCLRVWCLICC